MAAAEIMFNDRYVIRNGAIATFKLFLAEEMRQAVSMECSDCALKAV
jgi:hypothetical protein